MQKYGRIIPTSKHLSGKKKEYNENKANMVMFGVVIVTMCIRTST